MLKCKLCSEFKDEKKILFHEYNTVCAPCYIKKETSKPLGIAPNPKPADPKELHEILGDDYNNVALRVFKANKADECPKHKVISRILAINNGTPGLGRWYCWYCFIDLLDANCHKIVVGNEQRLLDEDDYL